MNNIAVRKQGNDFLVYFFEQRSTVKVNSVGAEILTMFLNESLSSAEIAAKLQEKYDCNASEVHKDVKSFLANIYERISTSNVNEAEQELLDKPLGVEIEITTACNLRCKHCFQGEYPEVYMSLEKFKWIVDLLKKNDVYEINLVGGEVFKHKDFLSMLKYLNEQNMAVTVVTNAVGIGAEELAVLKSIKNLFVLVSLDGTKELHDYIRGNGQFDLIMPKVIKMKEAGINIELLCTINAINVGHVCDIAEFGKDIGLTVNFNLFKPFSKKHEYLTVNPEDFFGAVEKLLFLRVKKGYHIGISNASLASYMLGLPEKNECTATLAGLVINTNGRMLTCPYLLEAGYYKEDELPIFSENFIDDWHNHPVFCNFRKNGQKGCQARSLIFSNDVCSNDPYDLSAYKKYKNKGNSQTTSKS